MPVLGPMAIQRKGASTTRALSRSSWGKICTLLVTIFGHAPSLRVSVSTAGLRCSSTCSRRETKWTFDSAGSLYLAAPTAQMETKMTNRSLPMRDTAAKGPKDPGRWEPSCALHGESRAFPWTDWGPMATSLLSDSLITGCTHPLFEGFLQPLCVAIS